MQPPVPDTIHYDEVVENIWRIYVQIVLKAGLEDPEKSVSGRFKKDAALNAYAILIKVGGKR